MILTLPANMRYDCMCATIKSKVLWQEPPEAHGLSLIASEKGKEAAMNEQAKKEALRLFTYGLYAISSGDEAEKNAFTANWLSQVSFDPPLVALSIERTSASLPIIRRTKRFVINVFGEEQRQLAGQLGKSLVKHPDKLEGVAFGATPDGSPILPETLAWVACEVESETSAGDSILLLARVVDAGVLRQGESLTMRAAGFKHAG